MTLRLKVTLKLPALPLFSPAQSRAILTQEVSAGVFSLVEQIATEARARTRVNTGLLRASIATRVVSGVSARTLVQGDVFTGAQAPYAVYVEYGRGPGRFPPRAPIELWAERVLGDKRLWFVISRAIARRGIRGRFMFRDSLAAIRPRIQPTLQAAVDRAVRLLGGQ